MRKKIELYKKEQDEIIEKLKEEIKQGWLVEQER